MKKIDIYSELESNSYPGRGIIAGKSANSKYAVTAYFIMGRSENSRNRVFVEDGEGIRTQAFDPAKLSDPSLIIYSPVRVLENKTIVTNGDQTDTIYDLMKEGKTFEQSLRTREFEPDAPNVLMAILIHAADLLIHIVILSTVKVTLFILIWVMEILFQALRENQN